MPTATSALRSQPGEIAAREVAADRGSDLPIFVAQALSVVCAFAAFATGEWFDLTLFWKTKSVVSAGSS